MKQKKYIQYDNIIGHIIFILVLSLPAIFISDGIPVRYILEKHGGANTLNSKQKYTHLWEE